MSSTKKLFYVVFVLFSFQLCWSGPIDFQETRTFGITLKEAYSKRSLTDTEAKYIEAMVWDVLFELEIELDARLYRVGGQVGLRGMVGIITTPEQMSLIRERLREESLHWEGDFSPSQKFSLDQKVSKSYTRASAVAKKALVELATDPSKGSGFIGWGQAQSLIEGYIAEVEPLKLKGPELNPHERYLMMQIDEIRIAFENLLRSYSLFSSDQIAERVRSQEEIFQALAQSTSTQLNNLNISDAMKEETSTLIKEIKDDGGVLPKISSKLASTLIGTSDSIYGRAVYNTDLFELGSAFLMSSINKVSILTNQEMVAETMDWYFTVIFFKRFFKRRSHLGFYSQSVLNWVATNKSMSPLARVVAYSLIYHSRASGGVAYFEDIASEELAALISQIRLTTTFELKPDRMGGVIKRVFLVTDSRGGVNTNIDRQLKLINKLLEAHGLSSENWWNEEISNANCIVGQMLMPGSSSNSDWN